MLADIIPLGFLTPVTFLIIGGIKNLLNLHRAARLDVYVGLLPPFCRWEHWGREVRSSWGSWWSRWVRIQTQVLETMLCDLDPESRGSFCLFLTSHTTQIGSLPSTSCMKSTEVMSQKHPRYHTDSGTEQGGKISRTEQWQGEFTIPHSGTLSLPWGPRSLCICSPHITEVLSRKPNYLQSFCVSLSCTKGWL